jgi:hypothetical protein
MPDAEITVQYLGTNKKNPKFGYIKTAEEETYGCLSEQLKQFSTGQVYTIRYHVNDKGYNEFDAVLSKPPVKQNVRPATNPADSDRMATMGMVNAMLNGICYGRPLAELLEIDPIDIAKLIGLCNSGLERSIIKGKQVLRRDDLDDEIPL